MSIKRVLNNLPLSTGEGVRIALLDSGAHPQIPALKGKSYKVFSCDQGNDGLRIHQLPAERNQDRNGHGSFVQGCIYQNAPDAEVHHFRILDSNNNTSGIMLCQVLDKIIAQGYHIINLSLGTRNEDYIPWLVTIIKRAYERNTLIVAANSNVGNVLYPARFTYCVSCDADEASDSRYLRYQPRSVVEFAGFGINVPMQDLEGNTQYLTGSSYAAAHVTGLAACFVESCEFSANVWEIKTLLKEYAENCEKKAIA